MKEKHFNDFSVDIGTTIRGLARHYDLGFVLNNLESLIILPIPYKNSSMSAQEFANNKALALGIINNFENTIATFKKELDTRKTTFDSIRRIYPDFCQNMNEKTESKIYQEYLELLKYCSKSISQLVSESKTRKNNYQELLLDRKDYVSSIIDSEENLRLTFIQDNFVLSELESIDLSNLPQSTQNNICKMKKDLIERISKYNTFEKLYSSSENVIRITNYPAKPDNTLQNKERGE